MTSYCSGCLQGLCRRHPLQDHGKRERAIKDELASKGGGAATQLQRSYTKMNLVSSVGGRTEKVDDLFKDEVLGRIGEHHAGTEMANRYGSKSIKEVKTRAAVDKWKKKREYDPNK